MARTPHGPSTVGAGPRLAPLGGTQQCGLKDLNAGLTVGLSGAGEPAGVPCVSPELALSPTLSETSSSELQPLPFSRDPRRTFCSPLGTNCFLQAAFQAWSPGGGPCAPSQASLLFRLLMGRRGSFPCPPAARSLPQSGPVLVWFSWSPPLSGPGACVVSHLCGDSGLRGQLAEGTGILPRGWQRALS